MSEFELAPGPVVFSGDIAPFAKAFVAAQKSTEAVKKAATNPHFRSKYADLAEVVEAVVPALNNNGIAVVQSPGFDGKLVSVTTILIHESGATMTGTLHLNPTKADPQGVGSAITYGRRYALLAMTGAAPEDDDGNAASQRKGSAASPQSPSKQEQTHGPDWPNLTNPATLSSHAAKQNAELTKLANDIKARLAHGSSVAKLQAIIEDVTPDVARLPETWRRVLWGEFHATLEEIKEEESKS